MGQLELGWLTWWKEGESCGGLEGCFGVTSREWEPRPDGVNSNPGLWLRTIAVPIILAFYIYGFTALKSITSIISGK